MTQARFIIILPAIALLAGCPDTSRTLVSGPVDPAASGPGVVYHSVFGDSGSVKDEAPIPWRAANDEMGRLGGHAHHAVAEPDPAAAPPTPGADPAPGQPASHRH